MGSASRSACAPLPAMGKGKKPKKLSKKQQALADKEAAAKKAAAEKAAKEKAAKEKAAKAAAAKKKAEEAKKKEEADAKKREWSVYPAGTPLGPQEM